MTQMDDLFEQFKVHGKDLAARIQQLLHEGNVRRIIVKNEQGHTLIEIPLTVATVGVIAAPVLAAVATLASMLASFTLTVERAPSSAAPHTPPAQSTDPSVGATEQQADMAATVSQSVNDEAGTGEPDAKGG